MGKKSAWEKGVEAYAKELMKQYKENISFKKKHYNEKTSKPASFKEFDKELRSGAMSWGEYSWGGSSLCYDGDIAKRLCNPSELKKTNNGIKRPNAREEWLDTQARALTQASRLAWEQFNKKTTSINSKPKKQITKKTNKEKKPANNSKAAKKARLPSRRGK